MIISFGDAATEDLYHGRTTNRMRRLPTNIISIALRKLDIMRAAHRLQAPPGNRLEALRGDYAGFYSLRVNDQWRIIFRFNAQEPWF